MRGGKRSGAGRKPGATSRAKRELAEMAKEYAEAALLTLVEIQGNSKYPAAARATAATAILDRGYGRPPQAIVGDPARPLAVEDVSDQKRIAAVALLAARDAMNGANRH